MLKVVLNHSACCGHGRCYELAPDVFASDREGNSVLKLAEVPPDLEDQARLAARNCPERAITTAE